MMVNTRREASNFALFGWLHTDIANTNENQFSTNCVVCEAQSDVKGR